MGGDHALKEIIHGVELAVNESDIHVKLVGDQSIIESFLSSSSDKISIVHAEESIGMDESPMTAFKQKKQSSIHVGLNLVKNGEADAFISAGNTGAVMTASLFILGRIPGVERPALASQIPTKQGLALMLDMDPPLIASRCILSNLR